MYDTVVTLFVKEEDQACIRFSRRHGRLQKQVRSNGDLDTSNTVPGNLALYRRAIREMVEQGWLIESTDQRDL